MPGASGRGLFPLAMALREHDRISTSTTIGGHVSVRVVCVVTVFVGKILGSNSAAGEASIVASRGQLLVVMRLPLFCGRARYRGGAGGVSANSFFPPVRPWCQSFGLAPAKTPLIPH